MATTKIVLDRQALARIFSFGINTAGNEGLLTIEKGTQAVSYVSFINRGSATIDGDLNLGGNLNITGAINEQSVTNLSVTDKVITLNKGGAGGSASASGIEIEAGGSTVAAFRWNGTNFTVGDGTTQRVVSTLDGAETLTNKSLTSPSLTGTPTAPTASAGTNNTQVATTAFVSAAVTAGAAITVYFRGTTVTGTQDGTNKAFTLGATPYSGSEQIFFNGQLLAPGASNDYVLSGTTVTFQSGFTAPASTDVIRAYATY